MPKSGAVWELGEAAKDLHEKGHSWQEIADAAEVVAAEAREKQLAE